MKMTSTHQDASDTTASLKTPKTVRGKARTAAILATAKSLFIEGGYTEMTMRKVSERLGISLSNLQHYFPTSEALLNGMLSEVMKSYDPGYKEITEKINDPKEQLAAVIRYLIADATKAETEKLFVEIWSLATRDAMVREIFDRMYVHQRKTLEIFVAKANPDLSEREVSLRSALIGMQIEGLMLLISESKTQHPELDGIQEACVDHILHMVMRPQS